MPLYNTTTTAAVLGVTPKWLDNLLSHNDIAGLSKESQGVARRLSISAITTLAVAKELIDVLNLPSPAALRLAERILSNQSCEVAVSPNLTITLRADLLKADILSRLARAVETVPAPRRGRPPKR
jgi:hypothetical protein